MTLDTKVRDTITDLDTTVTTIEKTRAAKDVLVGLARRLQRVADDQEAVSAALSDALGDEVASEYRELCSGALRLREKVETVTVAPPGANESVSLLQLLAPMLDGDEKAQAEEVLTRWFAVTPKRVRNGKSASPDLGFTVVAKCEGCKEVIASTRKENLNSLRDQVRQHHGKKHNHKFSRGDELHKGVTDAIKGVFKDQNATQGGGYVFVRSET